MVSLEEILIGKFLALLDRGAVRDVWDIAYPPQPSDNVFQSVRFRRWFIALSSILEHPLPTYSRARLEAGMSDRDIAERLSPMLAGDVPARIELIERAWNAVDKFLKLESDEAAYVAAVAQGELKPELLFPDNLEEAGRIAAHPAILWKLQNVKNYLARLGRQKNSTNPAKRRK